ncbi:DNA-binding transcriptional regulator, LysR family [Yoonia tamlensis]|uniref:DNA-binding transcriptional regulator, LysR family n=1 Tax=Yoonia tamlensis TaxID=390270 RepID=A0A1I6HZI0_9RHOB|nr:LysR family transcriptional regulator [Yoonia tamlensis]SFR59620.1 DNA-binding transcriptional regulator, LysR family [Yoonia tamlensis]
MTQPIDFDWTQARSFLTTAHEGSFSAAARKLRLTQPTLSRHVDALETRLGTALFEKSGQRLVLTPAGHKLLPHAQAMADAATALSRTAFGQSQDMRGPVVITAEELFAAKLLPRLIPLIQAAAPELVIDIIPDNAHRDLQTRKADIALRLSRPTEPTLIARRLPDRKGGFYASKSFIARHGALTATSDLTDVPIIAIDPNWQDFLQGLGLQVDATNLRLRTANHVVMWEMVCAGLGVGTCDSYIASQNADMRPVLTDITPITFPLWLVVHREVQSNPAVRLVYDILANEIPRLSTG